MADSAFVLPPFARGEEIGEGGCDSFGVLAPPSLARTVSIGA